MKAIGTFSLVVLMATPAWSQQPTKLSLRSALELAERQNPQLVAARQRRAVAQAGVRIARQLPNPTASFTNQRDDPHEGLFFDQPLEIGGRRHRRIELAQQRAGLTELESSALARQVRRSVREEFYRFALARSLSKQRGQLLELARRLQQIAQQRFTAGDIPQLEVLRADLEAARAEADYQVSQQQEKVALSQLNVLLNEPLTAVWELVGSLEDLPPLISLAELHQRAEQSNPELQRLAQEQRVEQSRRALLQAERIPNLDLQFGADFNSPHNFRVGHRTQLSLVLPLFTRNQGEIAESAASLRVLESEVAATRRAVAGRVDAAYYDLSARQSQVELYHRTLLPAAQRFESLAEESYRAGKSNLLTVLDAQRNVQQVAQSYLESLFAVQTAFASLEEAVGAELD